MRMIPLLCGLALLGGCALIGDDTLPVCDGKHRRPANPNGSVLLPPPSAEPLVLAPPPAAPLVATAPGQIGSCGR